MRAPSSHFKTIPCNRFHIARNPASGCRRGMRRIICCRLSRFQRFVRLADEVFLGILAAGGRGVPWNSRCRQMRCYQKFSHQDLLIEGDSVDNIKTCSQNAYKVYVDVDAHFTSDGKLVPQTIYWEDGQPYKIDKVTQIARRASLKAGGVGIRYTCVVNGQMSFLFHEADRWFVERRGK